MDIIEQFKHIQDESGYGGQTLCTLLDKETKRPLALGYALCSKKDQYKKSKGRLISRGRAQKALGTGKPIITSARIGRKARLQVISKPLEEL